MAAIHEVRVILPTGGEATLAAGLHRRQAMAFAGRARKFGNYPSGTGMAVYARRPLGLEPLASWSKVGKRAWRQQLSEVLTS